jgi:hypothetical protein
LPVRCNTSFSYPKGMVYHSKKGEKLEISLSNAKSPY